MKNTTTRNGRVLDKKSYKNSQRKYKSFCRNKAFITQFKGKYIATKHIGEVIADIFYFSSELDKFQKEVRKGGSHG